MVLPSEGHPASEARLYYQCGGIALDGAGNLFIAAYYGGAVYKVSPDGPRSPAVISPVLLWTPMETCIAPTPMVTETFQAERNAFSN